MSLLGEVRAGVGGRPSAYRAQNPAAVSSAGFCFGRRGGQAGSLTLSMPTHLERKRAKKSRLVSGAYLRQQAKILIAMSRATLDLGIAGRLRQMASELQARAAEQENECGFADNEVASFKRPVRMGS
jgi:hypothetical protein